MFFSQKGVIPKCSSIYPTNMINQSQSILSFPLFLNYICPFPTVFFFELTPPKTNQEVDDNKQIYQTGPDEILPKRTKN